MLVRVIAAGGAVLVTTGVLTSCAVAGSPALADPAAPTIESIEPPAPAAPPARSRPAPASSTAGDDAAIRQVVQTYWDGWTRADWDLIASVACPASHANMTDSWKHLREVLGPPRAPMTITSVTINGDTAVATYVVGSSPGVSLPLRRGENGWQLCN